MRIGFFIPTLKVGGAEKVASLLSFSLSKWFDIYLITFSGEVELPFKGIKLNLSIGRDKGIGEVFNSIKRAFLLRKLFEKEKLDLIISFDERASLISLAAGLPTIATFHSLSNWTDGREFSFLRFLYKNALALVTPSKGFSNYLSNILGRDVYTIHNPIEDRLFDMRSVEGDYGVNVGRMVYVKGQWHLIYALGGSDYGLKIIGYGPLEPFLRKKASVYKNVEILSNVDSDEVYNVVASSRIYLLSSYSECFPLSIAEAFALGKSVVATMWGFSVEELLGKELYVEFDISVRERGLVVPPPPSGFGRDYFHRLYRRAVEFLWERELRKEMEKSAREKAKEFKLSKVSLTWKEFIESTLDNYHRS